MGAAAVPAPPAAWHARRLRIGIKKGSDARFSPDGKLLCVKGAEGFTFWDIKRRRAVSRVPCGEVTITALSQDGKRAATAGEKGVTVWEVLTGKAVRTLPETRSPMLAVEFAPNGQTLMTVTDGSVLLWDLAAN